MNVTTNIHPAILMGIGICLVMLLWILLKEKFIQAIMRVILGIIIIYYLNALLPQYAIGLNIVSLSCSGMLGIPGVAMLYLVGSIL